MKFDYSPLWKTLQDKALDKKSLQKIAGFSSSTIKRIENNEKVSDKIIKRIKQALQCDIDQIVVSDTSANKQLFFNFENVNFENVNNVNIIINSNNNNNNNDIIVDSLLNNQQNVISSKTKREYTFIDLFAGIGGIRMAFEAASAKCVFSSEWDKDAQKTYEANFHEKPAGDITKIAPESIPNFNILTGGFPCQPFSMIGKREGFNHKTQGTLFFYIAEILRIKKPEAFLLENVPGLLTHDDGKTFEIIMETLDNLGYNVKYKVLNSADFGVPQYRQRLYFVGFKKELNSSFEFPEGEKRLVGIGQFVEKDAEGPSISEHLQETYIFKKDDGHPEIIDEHSDFPVKTLCASYHKIQRITGTFVRGGKTGLRLLTENECKAIMGFPLDFKVPVSRTQMYHQFGNSVAVPVVKQIALKMVEELNRINNKA